MNRQTARYKDHDYSFVPVPAAARKPFLSIFFVMLGFTFFSSSMSVGATLSNQLDFSGYALSVLAGSLILSVYTGALGYIGCDTGLSFDQLAIRSFGKYGSYISSAAITLTQIGWFGVGVAMLSNSISEVLHIPPLVLMVVTGACMTTSAYFGIRGMEIISYISVPLITVLGVYSMVSAVAEGGGLGIIFAKSTGGLTIMQAIGLVIGSFVAGGTTTPNFTRFAATRKSAVINTVIAFFLGNILMFSFGAVGGALTGKDDIFYVMMAQGLIVPAIIVLGANIWTTNDNTLYNAGLSLSNITRFPKRPLVIVAGIIGTFASTWIYDYFVKWLVILNAALPPIGTVIIVDFLMSGRLHRAHETRGRSKNVAVGSAGTPGDVLHVRNDADVRPFRAGNVIAIILGSAAGLLLPSGIASINAMLVSAVLAVLFNLKKADH